ncbi:MAG: sulfite exporter TauE/SafE family protein [Myxococcales bacterium]|nr:sulfite exporter TauE/SafE family protein [Myxococcales bacterium]
MELFLPVAQIAVNPLYLIALGLSIGFLAGLLGVGGGSLMTPMLNILFGVPYNVAVGTDLAQLLGSSTSASVRHGSFGHIDYRLGFLMAAGSAMGIETGAQLLTVVTKLRAVHLFGRTIPLLDLLLNTFYALLLGWIATMVLRESLRNRGHEASKAIDDPLAEHFGEEAPISTVGEKLRRLQWGPMIALPASGIAAISIWVVVGIGFFTGILSGFLGIGGGFIRLPALIYLIGCPTLVAVGTDLFEIMLSSAFGAASHAMKGNVDLVLAVVLITGSSIGSVLGASFSRRVKPSRLRTIFAAVSILGVALVLFKLISLFSRP